MIITIDQKIHHLKELDFIERQLYSLMNPEKFYSDLTGFFKQTKSIDLVNKQYLTFEETKLVDEFVRKYFEALIPEAQIYFLRAYIIGRLLAESDLSKAPFMIAELTKLPKYVQEAVKKYNLTMEEAQAMTQAVEKGAGLLSNTLTNTQQTVKNVLIESLAKREGTKKIEDKLREMIINESGELNRDWKRVAISETNDAFSNGYLGLFKAGEYVIGISMPDACEHCLDLLHNKIFRVRTEPPPDYSTLSGNRYHEIAEIWENEIWVGKSNFGRSTAQRKRIDKAKGNRADNLQFREHHELSMPVIPLHPQCRCRWNAFNPEFQWIDQDGKVRLKIEDREAHKKWYEENIET